MNHKFGIFFTSHIVWLKFITNHDKVITNYDSFAYYKLRRIAVTNLVYDQFFITNYDKVLTNYDSYYK